MTLLLLMCYTTKASIEHHFVWDHVSTNLYAILEWHNCAHNISKRTLFSDSLFLSYCNLSKHSSSLWWSINDHCWILPWALEILDVNLSFWNSVWHADTLGIFSKNHEYFREFIYSITWNRQTMMSDIMLHAMKNNFNWYLFMNHVAWHGLNGRKERIFLGYLSEMECMELIVTLYE